MLFLNISNHPSNKWSEEQKSAALKLVADEEACWDGMIIDIPFPAVSPNIGGDDIAKMADEVIDLIRRHFTKEIIQRLLTEPLPSPVIHVMGEMGLTFYLVDKLRALGFPCAHSTTERVVEEKPDGTKVSQFRFVKFRFYVGTDKRGSYIGTLRQWEENILSQERAAEARKLDSHKGETA